MASKPPPATLSTSANSNKKTQGSPESFCVAAAKIKT